MNWRCAMTFRILTATAALLLITTVLALVAPTARADTAGTVAHPVTATPPLQVVPTTAVSKNVQQRMRGCNAAADAKKLPAANRESFIKSCMATHRGHAISRPGSQPKTDP
jgi:hypothetical protein